MKKRIIFFIVVLIFIISVCGYVLYNYKLMGVKEYYTLEDFQDIKVGESTLQDVDKIAPVESLMLTSYGSKCEYPMEDGRHIYIKFYEDKLIVGEIGIR